MRQLLIIFLAMGNVAAKDVSRALQKPIVRRSAATDLMATATRQRIIPMILVPRVRQEEHSALHHALEHLNILRESLAERVDLLQTYIGMLEGKEVDIDSLVNDLYEEMEHSAVQYVSDRKDKFNGLLTWRWASDSTGVNVEFNDEKRKNILREVLQHVANTHIELHKRENTNHTFKDAVILLQERVESNEEQQVAADLLAFYQELPQLDTPLLDEEIATIKKLMAQSTSGFNDIMNKVEEQMYISIQKDEGVTLQQKVHLVDIFSHKKLVNITKNYFALKEAHITKLSWRGETHSDPEHN